MSEKPDERVEAWLELLGLPDALASRPPDKSLNAIATVKKMRAEREATGATHIIGLGISFVNLAEQMCTAYGVDNFPDVLGQHPPQTASKGGKTVNTLNLPLPEGGWAHLRTAYNKVEAVAARLRRYDYPSSAPHATQDWVHRRDLIQMVFALSPNERRHLLDGAWADLLALKRFERRSSARAKERPFLQLLNHFPHVTKPPGGVLQALTYAYMKSDAPNLSIETQKVGAGSKRKGAVGDVDGWTADDLDLTVEVKDKDLDEGNALGQLDGFLGNLVPWPDATAILVARSFTPAARKVVEAAGVMTLTRDEMFRNVELWDRRKQEEAVRAFTYYIVKVQMASSLIEAFDGFREEHLQVAVAEVSDALAAEARGDFDE